MGGSLDHGNVNAKRKGAKADSINSGMDDPLYVRVSRSGNEDGGKQSAIMDEAERRRSGERRLEVSIWGSSRPL